MENLSIFQATDIQQSLACQKHGSHTGRQQSIYQTIINYLVVLAVQAHNELLDYFFLQCFLVSIYVSAAWRC